LITNENDIKSFWQDNPCGENLVSRDEDWADYFEKYDAFRYRTEGHILSELDKIDLAEKKVLEIGIGQAADSLQLALRGAQWSGLDLTDAAVFRAKKRFELAGKNFDEIKLGSALDIPYPGSSFDLVYSHGVLHHIPDIKKASSEISRVLRPGGRLVIMMYHKNSLNYWLSIAVIRRVLMVVLWFIGNLGFGRFISSPVLKQHLQNTKKVGIFRYLEMPNFLYVNTDGPSNPYSKVYNRNEIEIDLKEFELSKTRVHFLNRRHFPGIGLLPNRFLSWLDEHLGWHLWAFLIKK